MNKSALKKKHTQSGFTLIELSIVIIIIGLLVAAIIVGGELVRAAQTRKVVTQIESYRTAVNTYRLKYDALPGDDTKAVKRLGATGGDAPHNGDGDGLIEGGGGNPELVDGEVTYFWEHLYLANFVDRAYTGDQDSVVVGIEIPEAAVGGGIAVYGIASTYTNYFHIGMTNSRRTSGRFDNNLVPEEAFSIDNKIDDGFPLRGGTMARFVVDTGYNYFRDVNTAISTTHGAGATATTAACVYQAGAAQDINADEYSFQTKSKFCQLRIRF
jgi:prepilin-type N-terminal cleavage/methylation domain-containing protein